MKAICTSVFLLLIPVFLYAQKVAPHDTTKAILKDTIVPAKGKPNQQLKEIKEKKVEQLSDSTGNEPKKSALVDTTIQNKYGDLLDDDTTYNRKYPLWIPLLETVGANAFFWSMDRYVMNYDFARIGKETWKNNLSKG